MSFAAHLQPTRQTDWVVYAKPPFAGPPQVLEYVGRYTPRVAIANQRLLDMDDGHVRFRYKNYRATPSQTPQTMTLDAPEFIRRFLLHVCRAASTASATTAGSAIGTARRSSPDADNSSERPRRRRPLATSSHPPTIATATSPSPASRYAAVPSVRMAP